MSQINITRINLHLQNKIKNMLSKKQKPFHAFKYLNFTKPKKQIFFKQWTKLIASNYRADLNFMQNRERERE